MSSYDVTCLEIFSKIKMLHWFSENFNEHEILDELASNFSEGIDKLIEAMINTKMDMSCKKINLDTEDSLEFCRDCLKFFNFKKKNEYINNILADIQGNFHVAIYKLEML